MATSTQLILTHGTTDLQIILRDAGGGRWRGAPKKEYTRTFHEWLLAHTDEWNVIDVPPELLGRDREVAFRCGEGESPGLVFDDAFQAEVDRDGNGLMQLALPKIGPALCQWLASNGHDERQRALQGALVLGTDRGDESQEPVATFLAISSWLAGKGVAKDSIHECIFLHRGERVDGPDGPLSSVVAQRIESAVNAFYNCNRRADLLVADIGGLPQVKPLLAELAALVAGARARSLFKTERGVTGLLPRSPIDGVRVRRQCLQQVREGALLEAWATAMPYRADPDARSWVQPLEQAAQLINGNPVGTRAVLPSLKAIIDSATVAPCLLVAIRVELALQGRRWLDAINGSINFMDAAYRQTIAGWCKKNGSYKPMTRMVRLRTNPPENLTNDGALEPRPEHGGGAAGYRFRANMIGAKPLAAWDSVINIPALSELRNAIYAYPRQAYGHDYSLADFRNFNTHGVLSQGEINKAIKHFMGADLWTQSLDNTEGRPKSGKAFLSRPLVEGTIAALTNTESTAQQLLKDLLAQLQARLLDPTAQFA